MITLTETAVKELKKVKIDQDLPNDTIVRVGVAGGGCSGFMYKLEFEGKDSINEKDDKVFDFNGLTVVLDKKSDLYIDGTTLDFITDLNNRGFHFANPQAIKNCGCNKSFSA